MELSERKKQILRAVIDAYVETAEPVGSKAVAELPGMTYSSATIRNEMAELEEAGYLEKPHTSAGRIPSPKGYRIYVNELMQRQRLTTEESEEITSTLRSKVQELDRVISDAGRLTAKLTSLPAYALSAPAAKATVTRFDLIYIDPASFIAVLMLSSGSVKNRVIRLTSPIVPDLLTRLAAVLNAGLTGKTASEYTRPVLRAAEQAVGDTVGITAAVAGFAIEQLSQAETPETFISGTSHLLEHPEYRDVDKAGKLMNLLSEGDGLRELLPPADGDLKITIGPENVAEELKDSSVIMATYNAGDNMRGVIGVIGPTRMDYSNVAAKLSCIASGLSKMLSGNEPPSLPEAASDPETEEK